MVGTRLGLATDRRARHPAGAGVLLLAAARRRPASTRSPSAAGTSAPTPSWADTTGGAKFRPDAYCVPPAGGDPFDGAHMKSFTRDGQGTVSGTRFARWRWEAPPGTGITAGARHLVARPPRRDRAAAGRR